MNLHMDPVMQSELRRGSFCFFAIWRVESSGSRKEMQASQIPRRHCVREVKELDLKSNGLCPHGFEPHRCRFTVLNLLDRETKTPTVGLEPTTTRLRALRSTD